jgi:hypothetical protein
MSQNRQPLNVATVTLNVTRFSLTVKFRNTTVKCRNILIHVKQEAGGIMLILHYVCNMGIKYLS